MRKVKVNVKYFETVSGVKKQYKDTKPKYRSNFNRLAKIRSGYRIYCENFDWSDIDEDLVTTDVLQELVMVKVSDSVHDILCHVNLINN